MNCPYCNILCYQSTDSPNINSCFSELDHGFIYKDDTHWWLLIRHIDFDFRFENCLVSQPPTMFVFSKSNGSNFFQLLIPDGLTLDNVKTVADKYIKHYNKLTAFI